MSNVVVQAMNLVKRYSQVNAVDHVDLTLEEGEVLGLLGPNGSGKTTTILMLLGLTEPTEGTVSILGMNPLREPLAVKRAVGYLPDSVGFYDSMSGRENLQYTARLGGYSPGDAALRIRTALERVRLSHAADKPVGTYSRGMRQRLGLAELLMRDSRIAILDEPTSGLDPKSTEELLGLIRGFVKEGMTVLISSHLLDVVQSICNRIALFNRGKIGFCGTVGELSQLVTDSAFHIEIEARKIDMAGAAGQVGGVMKLAPVAEGRWNVTAARDIRAELANWITGHGGQLTRLDARKPTLGESYNLFFREVSDAA